jgi:hypothetical protein
MIARRRVFGFDGDDRGSTLIAAVAVMALGLALGTVVLAQAIETARDSGRDRVRTIEVHGAEGAVDTMLQSLENSTPCTWPASGYDVVNTVSDKVGVSVKIDYYTATNVKLACTSGVVTGGTPAQAVVTSTAKDSSGAANPADRSVQAKVLIKPNVALSRGAAVFSATGAEMTNVFSASSAPGVTDVADVWVDSGNADCNSGATINGNLIVAAGTTKTVNSCKITGNVWSYGNFGPHQGTIGGNAWVAHGNAIIDPAATIGGDLLVSGSIDSYTKPMKVGGTVESNSTRVPQYKPVGLPEVLYTPSDWAGFATPAAYTSVSQGAWGALVASSAATNGAASYTEPMKPTGDKCRLAGANWSMNGPLRGSGTNTVYDLRACSQVRFEGGLELKLFADTALIVRDFYATGNWKVTSGDGLQHNFWLIHPDPDVTKDGTAECLDWSKGIKVDSGASITHPIRAFFYTPCEMNVSNEADFYGQIYGGKVKLQNKLNVKYDPIGIPGVSFDSVATSGSYRVDVVYKREMAN